MINVTSMCVFGQLCAGEIVGSVNGQSFCAEHAEKAQAPAPQQVALEGAVRDLAKRVRAEERKAFLASLTAEELRPLGFIPAPPAAPEQAPDASGTEEPEGLPFKFNIKDKVRHSIKGRDSEALEVIERTGSGPWGDANRYRVRNKFLETCWFGEHQLELAEASAQSGAATKDSRSETDDEPAALSGPQSALAGAVGSESVVATSSGVAPVVENTGRFPSSGDSAGVVMHEHVHRVVERWSQDAKAKHQLWNYIDQQQANDQALKYWSTRARELDANRVAARAKEAQLEREVGELKAELERVRANELAAIKEMAKARNTAMEARCDADLYRWIGHDKVEEFEAGSLVKKLWDKAKELETTLKRERVSHGATLTQRDEARAQLAQSEAGRAELERLMLEQLEAETANPTPSAYEWHRKRYASNVVTALHPNECAATPEPAKPAGEATAQPWVPAVPSQVRFKGVAQTYTVRGVDTNDMTACVFCDDGHGAEGWWPIASLEPVEVAPTTPEPSASEKVVTVAMLVKALRLVEEANPRRWFDSLADRLEHEGSK